MSNRKNPADKVQSRGAKRMKEKGCTVVQLWLDKGELGIMSDAARSLKLPLATWIRKQALHAAQAAALARVREHRRDDRGE
jgi:hypothetical protein